MRKTQKEERQEIKKLREKLQDKQLFLSEPYHRTVLTLVRSLAQKNDVSLVLDYQDQEDAKIAYTDGSMVYVNTANPVTVRLKSRDAKIKSHEGFAAHECGHIRCTDFNRRTVYVNGFSKWRVYPQPPSVQTAADKRAWKEMKGYLEAQDETAASVITHTAAYLSNVLEDIYIESFMCREYPGSVRRFIQRNASLLVADIPTVSERRAKKASGLTIMMDLIFRYARAGKTEVESSYPKQYQNCLNRCRSTIDEAVVSDDPDIRYSATNRLMIIIWKYLKKMIESTTQALNQEISQLSKEALKEKIKEYLKQNTLWVVLSDGGEASSGSVLLKDNIEGWDGRLNISDDKTEKRPAALDEKTQKQLEGFRKEEGLNTGEAEQDSESKKGDMWDLSEELPELLNEIAKEQYIKKEEEALKKSLESELSHLQTGGCHENCKMKLHRMMEVPPEAAAEYDRLAPEIRRISRKLQESIEEVLKKQEGGTMVGLYMGKRLSRGNLYRQDGKIFEKRLLPEEGFSIAIAVLMDVSGSMVIDNRIEFARKTALALYEFCHKLDIPIMVYGHTTHDLTFLSNEVVDIYAYADFDSMDRQDHLRIAGAKTGYCNRDGAALRFVGERLLKREEEIKILILISDGQPNAEGYEGETAKLDLQEVKRSLEKQGVKLFAAAIGDDKAQIEAIYKDGFLNITNLNTMPVKLAGLLTKYIR